MFLIPAKNQNQTWKYSIYCYLRYDRKQSARRTQMKIQGGEGWRWKWLLLFLVNGIRRRRRGSVWQMAWGIFTKHQYNLIGIRFDRLKYADFRVLMHMILWVRSLPFSSSTHSRILIRAFYVRSACHVREFQLFFRGLKIHLIKGVTEDCAMWPH